MKKIIVLTAAILLSLTFLPSVSKANQIYMGGCTGCNITAGTQTYIVNVSCGRNANVTCCENSGSSWIVYGPCTYGALTVPSGSTYRNGTFLDDVIIGGVRHIIFSVPALP